ncbi:type II toxin-antitoxin system VapC family toxin [uncultured Adlercreutzia sp.]|uniref:type II toxin-antitoxin system VapC family toxin n=1 Tax=uncultured Adlercreutzia sp. TaxID=875803 RepID=UPI0025FABA79|nr:type II toxin-antitoxin system VapC family toxin [uncultured Adlercreutzia sp.]
MYLLDTDTCIEILRGRLPLAQEYMRKGSPDMFGVPAIVEAELLFGAANSNNPEEGRFCVETLLSPLQVLPFDSRCAAHYANVRADLKKRGCMIGPNDLLIAATALANSAVLVSNNTREFKRVQGLMLESWGEESLA